MSIWSLIKNTRRREVVLILILLALAGQFVRSSLGTFSVVEGESMSPTFHPDDVVQARSGYTEMQRGDVVIMSDADGERVIKRIVGLPGEKLTLYRGFVYIDGQRLNEPYLPKCTYTFKSSERNERPEVWKLTDYEYFVLGDNRSQSTDSRYYGPVTRYQILSVVDTAVNAVRPTRTAITLLEDGEVTISEALSSHRGEMKLTRLR
jgi:signal peptidase I